jgi:hypothetical protein
MEVKVMRQAILSFLLLCSAIAFGQEPQWTVVQHVVLLNQNQNIPLTTLFTPTEPAVYRLTIYFSGVGTKGRGAFAYFLNGVDISGQTIEEGDEVSCPGTGFQSPPPITTILKPQVPFQYVVVNRDPFPPNSCYYNLAITVEQLVQQ